MGLTAIEPGTERPRPAKRPRGEGGEKPRPRRRARGADGKAAGRGGKRQQRHEPARRKKPPKPLVPITEEMKEGKAPMKTFGDLKQFFETKKGGGEEDKK